MLENGGRVGAALLGTASWMDTLNRFTLFSGGENGGSWKGISAVFGDRGWGASTGAVFISLARVMKQSSCTA